MPLTLGPIFNAQNNKIREWSITVHLYDKEGKEIRIANDVDKTVVKEGFRATYATLSGYSGMKMTESAQTIITVGKNLGKKNETNVLTQAYKESTSKYAAKLKAGYTETQSVNTTTPQTPFPMAVKSWKDQKAKLSYPLYIQPKLDGVRMVARYDNGEVHLLTRRLHDVSGFEAVKSELKQMFDASGLKTFIIDGELYSHGINLQTISGIVRNVSMDEATKQTLQYHVFDCFDTSQESLTFRERLNVLERFVGSVQATMVVLNDTIFVKDDLKAEQYYRQLVAEGYEGVIYKSSDRPYEFDFNKERRSSWYLKRKKQDDGEYPIIGYTQGKGKDLGCIVFELQGPNNKTFNCVPNGTYDYRKQLFAQAETSFDSTFKGKLAKVVYDDLSKDGVPLRGRIVQIGRDLSFD